MILWLLFHDVLSFTAKNIPEKSDFPLLQSMIKVFYLFRVQHQFDNDEVTGVLIQCNICNKTVTCKFSKTVTIKILLVFTKYVVFHHVGYSG